MLDFVKDCYHNYEEVKDVELDKLSGIYILSGHNTIFLERFNDIWTYETIKGKYDYKLNGMKTVGDIINQLKSSHEIEDDNFTIRLYDFVNENVPDFIKLIIPGHRKLINQEIFGNYELSRLREVNLDAYKDDPDMSEKFLKQMDIVNSDVSQIVRLISSQAHTNETLNLTMKMVSNILASIPLTPITDDKMSEKDWVDFDTVEEASSIKEYFDMEGYETTKVYLNIRCSRIVKVYYKNINNGEEEYHYYDTYERIFIDRKENEAYFGKMSIGEIDLPWSFRPTEEVTIDDEDLKKDLVKVTEINK